MKKIYSALFVLGFILLAGLKPASAQEMGGAQAARWDVTKLATVNADQATVWELISNLKNIQLYAKGFIKSVEIKGSTVPFDRIITFEDGTTRTEQIDQVMREYKFLSYQIKAESLPKGLKDVSIGLFTKSKGDSTEVSWQALIEGSNEAKKAFKEQLSVEFEKYASGLTDLIKNSTPAAKMN
ncbi:SRPBCC family protein [Pedobacter nyackensis]|uniref:Polyketide cyclase / dehydrase and lipid transport n=1 Tax=Pedobacter nyackensis TaxID=475255 RepID=A0A1W2DZ73_9SPHI|nr:SRPBCC family protein [Pedobacter nyackensis]SMD02865.1 Polyketide cyclase / dehydrase and lipid transport [Pedobacter nyackensis]